MKCWLTAGFGSEHADAARAPRRRPRSALLGVFVGLLAAVVSVPAADDLAARVLVLANADDPDSLRVAEHYVKVREVPRANVIALPLPHAEEITWREFVVTLWQPLLARLVQEKWIDAIPMQAADALGRRKYAVYGHRIAALVTCRGVPLKIAHDPEFYAEVKPFTARPEFRTNAGAVDAELSLLAVPNYPITAFIPNPLYQDDRPTAHELRQVVKVARLDGPTREDAMGLVDRAVEAERVGLLGRAYVDLALRDQTGDPWFDNVATQLDALEFDLSVDRAPATLSEGARFDAPILYFGWYASDVNGPFALPGFRFPPGAIALHLHSYSASSMRNPYRGWTAPFVARGVTATVGNVYEPYLQFTHRPNLFLRALVRGATLVDAAYYSAQGLSWQQIVIGDPLYRPFGVRLDKQLENLETLPPKLAGYAVLRRMRQLDAAKKSEEATALAISVQRKTPCVAVGVALAQRLRDAGAVERAASALGFATQLTVFPPDEWALAREAALILEACGRPEGAVEIWRTLLAMDVLPRSLREPWLREGAKAARAAREIDLAKTWEKEAAALAATEAEKK